MRSIVKNRAGPISGTVSVDKVGLDNAGDRAADRRQGHGQGQPAPATDAIVIDSGSVTSDALNSGFDGQVSLADGAIDLNLKADAAISALPAAARGMLGERAEISAMLKRDANGSITVDAVKLSPAR